MPLYAGTLTTPKLSIQGLKRLKIPDNLQNNNKTSEKIISETPGQSPNGGNLLLDLWRETKKVIISAPKKILERKYRQKEVKPKIEERAGIGQYIPYIIIGGSLITISILVISRARKNG